MKKNSGLILFFIIIFNSVLLIPICSCGSDNNYQSNDSIESTNSIQTSSTSSSVVNVSSNKPSSSSEISSEEVSSTSEIEINKEIELENGNKQQTFLVTVDYGTIRENKITYLLNYELLMDIDYSKYNINLVAGMYLTFEYNGTFSYSDDSNEIKNATLDGIIENITYVNPRIMPHYCSPIPGSDYECDLVPDDHSFHFYINNEKVICEDESFFNSFYELYDFGSRIFYCTTQIVDGEEKVMGLYCFNPIVELKST